MDASGRLGYNTIAEDTSCAVLREAAERVSAEKSVDSMDLDYNQSVDAPNRQFSQTGDVDIQIVESTSETHHIAGKVRWIRILLQLLGIAWPVQ